MMCKTPFTSLRLTLMTLSMVVTLIVVPHPALAASTFTLEQPVYFMGPDEEPFLVAPGTYQVEAADAWLKLIPEKGPRTEAMLVDATSGTHDTDAATPEVVWTPDEAQPELRQLMLILPDGTGLAAVGSTTGIWPRGGDWTFHPPTRAERNPCHHPRADGTVHSRRPITPRSKASVHLDVAATATHGVDHVQIKIDNDASVCSLQRHAPYDCTWDTSTAFDGRHTLRAVITDKKKKQRHLAVFVTVCNELCKVPLKNFKKGGRTLIDKAARAPRH